MTIAQLSPDLRHWLLLSTALFGIGLYGLLTRRNLVGVLISIELLLNSAALNFVIFNRHLAPERVDGVIMALFIVAVAAAESIAALAIFVLLGSRRGTMDVVRMDALKETR